ncbi:trypsin-like peptidase domain-containing protein [Aquincola tertiaricarbonis]|uniref:trypsin-like peptidase domain-containing protein n=1 Tax=Aquincola tertiaricarbonis TaxID=391953 RepID=UPI0009FB4387|nr:trypsin-like peptidase domain-containing protein [Aquincola tertiaricarbonis]
MKVDSLAENLFFTTVRIDTVASNGAQGSGTGFLFVYKLGDDKHAPFVVTNKHVVNGMQRGSLTFHQRKGDEPNLGTGFRLDVENWANFWFGHPSPNVDIAITPFLPLESHIKLNNSVDLFYRFIDSGMLPTKEQEEQFDAIESVTFIGYPNGIWDSRNLLPVARRGTTASPMSIDFEGTPRFVIDASVFGGSSGSPVFVLNQGMITDKRGNSIIGSRVLFVGVVTAVFFRTQLNQIIAVPVPTQTRPMTEQQEMIDLGLVFKARTVVETVEAFIKASGGA